MSSTRRCRPLTDDGSQTADREFIADVRVFDVYEGENLAEGKKSIALALTFQPKDKTFTDQDIENLMNKVIQEMKKKCNARTPAVIFSV